VVTLILWQTSFWKEFEIKPLLTEVITQGLKDFRVFSGNGFFAMKLWVIPEWQRRGDVVELEIDIKNDCILLLNYFKAINSKELQLIRTTDYSF